MDLDQDDQSRHRAICDATPPHGLPNSSPRQAVMSSFVAEQTQGQTSCSTSLSLTKSAPPPKAPIGGMTEKGPGHLDTGLVYAAHYMANQVLPSNWEPGFGQARFKAILSNSPRGQPRRADGLRGPHHLIFLFIRLCSCSLCLSIATVA